MKTETVMWLFPIIFMIHDFEEVVMFKPWVTKNAGFIKKRFPRLAARMLPHMESLSTSSFALAVAGMFLIVSAVTLISVELDLYYLWAAAVIGYFIHLVVHVTQFLVVRRYVPVVITSLVTAPYCIWALVVVNGRHPLPPVPTLVWSVAAFVVIVGAVVFMHGLAARFERWLKAAF
jgi:hypothetical protein